MCGRSRGGLFLPKLVAEVRDRAELDADGWIQQIAAHGHLTLLGALPGIALVYLETEDDQNLVVKPWLFQDGNGTGDGRLKLEVSVFLHVHSYLKQVRPLHGHYALYVTHHST